MNLLDIASEVLVGLVVFALVFFVTRKLWLWYWRIPDIQKQLAEIAATLRRIERKEKEQKEQR